MQRVSSVIAMSGSCMGTAAKPGKAIRVFGDELRDGVVRLARDLRRLFRIGDTLNRRIVQAQDDPLDAVLVHFRQTKLLEVQQAPLDIGPCGKPAGVLGVVRGADGVGDGEVLFERDLSLHRWSGFYSGSGCVALSCGPAGDVRPEDYGISHSLRLS